MKQQLGLSVPKAQEMWIFPSREDLLVVALPFLVAQTAPALRFGSNTPPCSPAPQKIISSKDEEINYGDNAD